VQAHGGAATKRKRGSASAAAAGGTPASAGGRAATAGGKAAPGAPPPANKRRAKAKSGRAREAAEATLLRIQRTFSAELEAVQSDMRDAFTHGFRNNDRLPDWRAALAREATQLAAALAAVDAVSGEGCGTNDRAAVVAQRGVAAAAIQQRIEAVQLMQATCAALWRAFGALRLVDAPPAAAPA
jgi:hypothetical protein